MSKSLAVLLTRVGMIKERQIESLLARAEQEGRSILAQIIESGLASDQDVARCLAHTLKIPLLHPLPQRIAKDVLALLPASFAMGAMILPLEKNERESLLTLAFADPVDQELQDEICFRTGMKLRVCVAGYHEVEQALRRHYLGPERLERERHGAAAAGRNIDVGDLFRTAGSPQAAARPVSAIPQGIPIVELESLVAPPPPRHPSEIPAPAHGLHRP
ncbi:MAG: hypothetical protein FJ125_08970, partial [Deltaproteobacteria bacterium]|nr:hypothetical protein [Deltaproteobacteria bacterium]